MVSTRLILGIIVPVWLVGCASRSVPSSGSRTVDYNSYNEDLSAVRPSYSMNANTGKASASSTTTTTPRKPDISRPESGRNVSTEPLHINRQLDAVMDTIATRNRTVRYAAGYRVQIYVGNERQKADAAKLLIYQNFPELTPYLSYQQPTYKLKVGDFMRRMDAERYYSSIKQLFPSALLQPDRVDIRKSQLLK